ncbi:MAG: cysteine dioxygenase family protein [Acidobacteriota bacterium]
MAELTRCCDDFPGRDELVDRLDAAVCRPDCEGKTSGVQETLTDMIRAGRLDLPADVKQPVPGAYARRLVYHSAEHGYVVVAMIWGPRQGTALHDHDGVWCVEGVLEGEIDVTRYEPLERDDETEAWRFGSHETVKAGVGTSGSLIPPFEYHTIANGDASATAVTLHVYGRDLERAHIFEPVGDGWYRRVTKQLGYLH